LFWNLNIDVKMPIYDWIVMPSPILFLNIFIYFYFYFSQFCDVAQLVITHKYIYPNLAIFKIWK
jgi:hypothetical protein